MTQCHWLYRYKYCLYPSFVACEQGTVATKLWFEAVLEKIAH